jgi:membrane fusion protein (multidrug efflux system)
MVKSGDVLVEIDPAIAALFVARAEAELAEAQRNYRRTVANNSALSAQVLSRGSEIAEAEAKLAGARADLAKSGADLRRNQQLSREGIVSAEQLDASRKALAAAQAAVAAGQAAIAQARSRRSEAQGEYAANDALVRGSSEHTDPAVRAARAKLEHARLDLASNTLRAPIDGVVTRRQVQLGQHVMPGQVLMTIVPVSQAFVDANFKERQLDRVRVGMPAKVTFDLYGGDVVFHGKVSGIAGGTGASMSMIPAQNATGNWIKVVQRLPVRIELDPKELAAHPLRVGLSAEVEIDVSGD